MRDTFTVGTRPPAVQLGAAGSALTAAAADPDGGAVTSYAWDLDGDRAFDDATGSTATALGGSHLVGVMATDAGGDIGIAYAPVTATSTPSAPRFAAKTKIAAVRLAKLRSRGLTVTVTCTAACRSTIVATVDKATAKRLKLGRKLEIGRGSGKGSRITVKLNAKALKALAKTRSVKIKLTVKTIRVGTSQAVVTTKTVKVKR